jgi:dTDP-glucose 4,6-dehydratase
MKTILITGGAGFVGHFLVKKFIKDYKIICLVRSMTRIDRLKDIQNDITFIEHDIKLDYDHLLDKLKDVDIILHAGANPSSEFSVKNPITTIMDNVVGTAQLLELARKLSVEKFVYYSAAEIFGPVTRDIESIETDRYNTISPYAASKASGIELCMAYYRTFNVPISIIHLENTFGERCQVNRFPVICIRKILNDQPVDIHIDNSYTVGGRRWSYAGNVADHTEFILKNQKTDCELWNSTGYKFISNLEFVTMIAQFLDKKLEVNYIPIDRLGHNLYFTLNPKKLYDHGWVDTVTTEKYLQKTVEWYKHNQNWLQEEK